MSVLRRGFLFSAIAAALAASPASGAWTAPATISAPHAFIGGFYGENVVLASGSAGVLAAWPFEDGFAPHAVTGASEAMAPPGGRFGAERHLPRAYASGPMVAMGGGRVVQLILAPAGTNQSSMAIAIGDVSGRFGRSIAVPGRAFGQRVSVAGNARGDVLVSWIAADSHGQHPSAWASVRFAGGRFANPVRLAAGLRTERVWAAIGRGRRMVVAFDSRVGLCSRGSAMGAVPGVACGGLARRRSAPRTMSLPSSAISARSWSRGTTRSSARAAANRPGTRTSPSSPRTRTASSPRACSSATRMGSPAHPRVAASRPS